MFTKRTTLTLMLLAFVSKLVGLGRDIALTYFYGTSNISDIYIISLTIPSVIFSFLMMGLSSGYIPIYSRIESKQGSEEALKFTNNVLSIITIISTFIVLPSLLYTEQIIKVFASGFEGQSLTLAVTFTRYSLLSVYFMGFNTIFNDYLRIKGKFFSPSTTVIIANICLVILIFISKHFSLLVLALSTVLVAFLNFLLLLPIVIKAGFKFNWCHELKNENIRNLITLSLPLVFGVAVNEINVLVDRTLASQILVGGISALTYASRLNLIVQGIFVVSIVSVLYPFLSKKAATDDMIGFKKSLSDSIMLINLLVIPVTVGLAVFASPIVSLLFGRGAFGQEAISITSKILLFYSLGMIGVGLREVLARSFYSLKDTKTPMINASFAVLVNIVLNIVLSKYFGISGLAIATSISATISTTLLFLSLRKKIGPFGVMQLTLSFLKIVLASTIMGFFARHSYNFLIAFLSQNISLLISITFGALLYFFIIVFMKIDAVDNLVRIVLKKHNSLSV